MRQQDNEALAEYTTKIKEAYKLISNLSESHQELIDKFKSETNGNFGKTESGRIASKEQKLIDFLNYETMMLYENVKDKIKW